MKKLAKNAEDKDYLKSSRSSSLSEVIIDTDIPKSFRNKNQMADHNKVLNKIENKNDLEYKINKYYDSSSENEQINSHRLKDIMVKSEEKEKYRQKKEQGK